MFSKTLSRLGLAAIESGVASGARLLTSGHALEGRAGYYVQPTALVDVGPSSAAAQEEIFGPVLCLTPCRSPAYTGLVRHRRRSSHDCPLHHLRPGREVSRASDECALELTFSVLETSPSTKQQPRRAPWSASALCRRPCQSPAAWTRTRGTERPLCRLQSIEMAGPAIKGLAKTVQ